MLNVSAAFINVLIFRSHIAVFLSYFQLGTPRHCPMCIRSTGKESVLQSFVSDVPLTRSHCCCPICLIFSWRGVTVAVLRVWCSTDEKSLLLSYLLDIQLTRGVTVVVHLLNIQLTRSHCCCSTCLIFSWLGESLLLSYGTCLIFSWRGVTVAVLLA